MQHQVKNIVITGASRRLGLFLTEQFLQAGDNVVAITRNASAELSALQCDRLSVIPLEDYTPSCAQQVAVMIQEQQTQIDVLIHNASVFQADNDVQKDLAQHYQALFNIHMAFPAQLNLALQPQLEASGSASVIHITDIYVDNPKTDFSLYCSTKAGLENLTKGFAKKFAPAVRVNSIQPGPIQFLPDHTQTQKDTVMAQTPLAREGGFEPIHQAIKSLLQNDFVTGTCLKVDGGRSISAW
ncbi:Dihydromonapterin reductase [Thalassocella blandensis]|nr:Dihydromonapterin reductase [Thalassocella blandensis]